MRECRYMGTSFTCHLELHDRLHLGRFQWGIDIIGKISPKSSSGHEFILVAIDYFTKWVEAASYARLTSSGVASFIRSHIICRYGVPHELISDRGVHFRAEVDTLVQRYSIRHHRSSAYRPQTNGAVEAANKNIKRILRRMVETSRDWSEKLPFALWAYRTSFRTSTGATPYSLVYGMEAVLPVEIEMGSLGSARFDRLNLLDERRLRADHVRAYRGRWPRFQKRVRRRMVMDLDGNRFSRLIQLVFGLPDREFMDPHGLARSSLRVLTERGHDRYLTEPRDPPSQSALLDTWMPSCLSICETTCAMIDDSMLSDLRPIVHFNVIQGHISVRMRFTDHEGVASPLVYMIIHGYGMHARSVLDFILSGYSEEPLLSHSARFFDIVVILDGVSSRARGLSYHHFIGSHVDLLCIPIELFMSHQDRSGTSDAILGHISFLQLWRWSFCHGSVTVFII
ncbi:hypothetical protein AAG906_012961 [Vitis piasezkii]